MDDLMRECPTMTADEKTAAQAELDNAKQEAIKSWNACQGAVHFDGATFDSALRAPSEIDTLRWHGCGAMLSFPDMRVIFVRSPDGGAPQKGDFLLTDLSDLAGRWAFRGALRLCEQTFTQ
jgi:hypothetical protein